MVSPRSYRTAVSCVSLPLVINDARKVMPDGALSKQSPRRPLAEDSSFGQQLSHGTFILLQAQELKQLQQAPPPGVCAWPVEDQLNQLEAQVRCRAVLVGAALRPSVSHIPHYMPLLLAALHTAPAMYTECLYGGCIRVAGIP